MSNGGLGSEAGAAADGTAGSASHPLHFELTVELARIHGSRPVIALIAHRISEARSQNVNRIPAKNIVLLTITATGIHCRGQFASIQPRTGARQTAPTQSENNNAHTSATRLPTATAPLANSRLMCSRSHFRT